MRVQQRFLTKFGLIGAAVALVLLTASCAVVSPGNPPSDISLATGFDLAQVGYQRSEFFLSGIAASYAPTAPLPTEREVAGRAAAARCRGLVQDTVRRAPSDGPGPVQRHGGRGVAQRERRHRPAERLDHGPQRVHPEGLCIRRCERAGRGRERAEEPIAAYASLFHPGDSYSYDIFTQAGERVRAQAATVLGGLHPQRILATGESQSASRLVTYINAIHPLVHVYDGFMVHSRGAGGSRLSQNPQPDVSVPSPAPIRDDLDVPVMVVEAEGDVVGSNLGARQPDTRRSASGRWPARRTRTRTTTTVGFGDIGDGRGATRMLELMQHPNPLGCARPINAGPHHWILQAAFRSLDTWVRTGVAPPVATPLVTTSTSPVVLARDAQGNALGGVRSPQVDAPIATLDAVNSGPSPFCSLFGSTTPFTPAQLAALYPTHQDFVTKWTASLFVNTLNGFLLPEDIGELYSAAAAAPIPA